MTKVRYYKHNIASIGISVKHRYLSVNLVKGWTEVIYEEDPKKLEMLYNRYTFQLDSSGYIEIIRNNEENTNTKTQS